MINARKICGQRNALGNIVKDGDVSRIQYKTYDQFFNEAQAIGSAIITQELFNTDGDEGHHFVGLFSKNRP